jgi:hypothetical protein
MKTAMQEFIEEIVEHLTYDDSLSEDSRVTYETIRLRCISKLEKEKEQIIDAYNQGALDGESSMLEYPNYYNQNYGE